MNLRPSILLLIAITWLVGCRTGPRPVENIARQIRHAVSPGWTVVASNNVIRVESKDDVFLLNPIGLPFGAGTDQPNTFKEYGWKTKYLVTISFVPRMGDSALEVLKEKRRPYENIRTASKDVASRTAEGLARFPLPSFYTENYSIFVVPAPYGVSFLMVYPPEAAQRVNSLTNVLTKMFRAY